MADHDHQSSYDPITSSLPTLLKSGYAVARQEAVIRSLEVVGARVSKYL